MSISELNPAQMAVLESFASIKTNEELNGLMEVLKMFYAKRLDAEMEKLWNDGTLNQPVLETLKTEHFRTPYRG